MHGERGDREELGGTHMGTDGQGQREGEQEQSTAREENSAHQGRARALSSELRSSETLVAVWRTTFGPVHQEVGLER